MKDLLNVLILSQDEITSFGLQNFLTEAGYRVSLVNNYSQCLDTAKFLDKLSAPFLILAQTQLVDAQKCQTLVSFTGSSLILCEQPVTQASLLLALNYNSSYISLECTDPQHLLLAVQSAFLGCVFICPKAKQLLNTCTFKAKIDERKAIASLKDQDRHILFLLSQGYTQTKIARQLNYSAVNVRYRIKEIVRKLNLQTKQEAIALATRIGLTLDETRAAA